MEKDNILEYDDIINLSREEIVTEYCKLCDKYQNLLEASESDAQRIHELKRSLETALAAEAFLSHELEQVTNTQNSESTDNVEKIQHENAEVHKQLAKIQLDYSELQQNYNSIVEENTELSEKLKEAIKHNNDLVQMSEINKDDSEIQRLQSLENENLDLLEAIQEFKQQSVKHTLSVAEYNNTIESLRDKVACLEENLNSKTEELTEKLQMLESTQEQLVEANAKIALMSSAPENNDRKGNSLFAEVDDQRKAMKQLLMAQKRSFIEMKKKYNESEYVIRRLQRENISMHNELEACSSIFCSADRSYQGKLNERIRQLSSQKEELERKLSWTQQRLKDLASENDIYWLSPILTTCKMETDDLKEQLHSLRIQKAISDEELRDAQQNMVRWRFESLKSRCVIMDREHLLNQHKIAFKPVQNIEFNATETMINQAKPRIISTQGAELVEGTLSNSKSTPKATSKTNIADSGSLKQLDLINENTNEISNENGKQEQTFSIENNKVITSDKVEKVPEQKLPLNDKFDEENKENKLQNNKAQSKGNANTHSDNKVKGFKNFAKLKASPPSPMRPSHSNKKNSSNSPKPKQSILVKHCNLLSQTAEKSVKFCQNISVVHNLEPDHPATDGAAFSNNNNTDDSSKAHKSNVFVRRIVVGSRRT